MQTQSALSLIFFTGIVAAQGLEGPVTVFSTNDRPMPEPALRATPRESAAAVLPSLIRLSWRSQTISDDPQVHYRIAIIRFHGECRAGDATLTSQRFTDVEALGQTQVVNGHVLPMA